jgi:hypothetical protein
MFRNCLRTNSDFCPSQHKFFGFDNRDEKCLLRGTVWVFKWNIWLFFFKGLNSVKEGDSLWDIICKTKIWRCQVNFIASVMATVDKSSTIRAVQEQNVGNYEYLPLDTASYPRRLETSRTPSWWSHNSKRLTGGGGKEEGKANIQFYCHLKTCAWIQHFPHTLPPPQTGTNIAL